MGSEQSQPSGTNIKNTQIRSKSAGSTTTARLQRGNTIAVTGQSTTQNSHNQYEQFDRSVQIHSSSRPVSPPISVCSDSDLPYISYTDKPIGDSPKLRNKSQSANRSTLRNSMNASTTSSTSSTTVTARKQILPKNKAKTTSAHNIVVVRGATKISGIETDSDIQKLQSIPQFLPVMRGTLSLPANRDPEVLERLQPIHLSNLANRMEVHFKTCATKVGTEQTQISTKIKEVDQDMLKLISLMTEKQKLYAHYAEQFSKIRNISQQLSRCNMLLNKNIESMEMLNNLLDVNDRLEPFVWKTS